ncbi:trk system potassium uptake protein TrkH [Lachnospiraceae bacterium C7]|nr:trk system potassium uptake protein TrkH [Lachnospiraceae bacterium C7]
MKNNSSYINKTLIKEEKGKKKRQLTSSQIIPLGFLAIIIIGTVLLWLPISSADGVHTSLLTALFTATTSTCVTGLVVVDTYANWSFFGQVVILALIQIGGMGIVSISTIMMVVLHKKVSIRDRVLIRDSFNLDTIQGLIKFLFKVFKGVFIVEAIGTICYAIDFIPRYGILRGLWYSIFNSISAFCNAGMDVIGPNSMMDFNKSPLLLNTTMMLIILGGLGYIVWFDILDNFVLTIKKRRRLSQTFNHLAEHSKLVIKLTIGFILSGAVLVFILEFNNPDTLGKMQLGDKILNSLFQSVTLRTAGFASIPQEGLKEVTAFIGCIFMFIGGSPMGTAGGIKTVTIFVIFLTTTSFVRNRREVTVYGRTFSNELVRKAMSIFTVSLVVTLILTILLAVTNNVSMIDAMYEIFSATGTVGVSRGLTSKLNGVGRIIVIISMYLGRIGPISIGVLLSATNYKENEIKHANGRFLVG